MRLLLAALIPACTGTTPVVQAAEPAPMVVDHRAAWETAARQWNAVTLPGRWVSLSWPRFGVGGEVWEIYRGEPGPGLAGWTDGENRRVVVRDWTDPVVLLSTVSHEMGHVVCGRYDHVAGVGSVMSNDGPWTTDLSSEDVEWCREAGACP